MAVVAVGGGHMSRPCSGIFVKRHVREGIVKRALPGWRRVGFCLSPWDEHHILSNMVEAHDS
ncbi:hypothetical protein CGMCC3_g15377 [Colletotrichum fructicola]|nr:uncharacterized protein CGMCC3_g15377 [Colletotrichum fructicola]KAE9568439.1 hypothetical protein CGMCC3_g15377 [Colletotrichum fructicola]